MQHATLSSFNSTRNCITQRTPKKMYPKNKKKMRNKLHKKLNNLYSTYLRRLAYLCSLRTSLLQEFLFVFRFPSPLLLRENGKGRHTGTSLIALLHLALSWGLCWRERLGGLITRRGGDGENLKETETDMLTMVLRGCLEKNAVTPRLQQKVLGSHGGAHADLYQTGFHNF